MVEAFMAPVIFSSLISVLGCTVGANGPYDIHAMDASFWGTLPLGLPLAYLKPP